MSPRHKSKDSSSSSDSDSFVSHHQKHQERKDQKHKEKQERKDQKHKEKQERKDMKHGVHPSGYGDGSSHAPPLMPDFPSQGFAQAPHAPAVPSPYMAGEHHQEPFRAGGDLNSPPPAYSGGAPPHQAPPPQQAIPPSGFRVPLSTTAPFPNPSQTGPPAFRDADGSPIFIGSALFSNSVHPCKIGAHLQPYASVPYGGGEHGHHGRFDLLPFIPEQMEWVPTSHGRIPLGRRPIEGGYEDNGGKLYHAVALIDNLPVPGKTGEHLGGSRVAFGGVEHAIDDRYEILCWR